MLKKLIISTVFLSAFLLSAAFAAFNMQPVSLDLLFIQWQLPLAVLMIAFLLLGLLIGAMLILLGTIRIRYQNHQLSSKLQTAEQELNSLRILPVRDNR